MKYFCLICICIFFLSEVIYSQEKTLFGKIENDKDVEGIHILNTTSLSNTVTNASGNFFLPVKPLDTIYISSLTYLPEKIVVSKEMYEQGYVTVILKEAINELAEVYIGSRLTGILSEDIQQIQFVDPIDFFDVGIPGFKGKPQERIEASWSLNNPLKLNIDALYKNFSGYYKTLNTKRKWEIFDKALEKIITHFTAVFFTEAYQIPSEKLEEFIRFCMETSSLQSDFKKERFALVIEIFSEKSKIYLQRLSQKEE